MRISSSRLSTGVPPTTLFESPRKYSDRSLQALTESITKRADVATLSVRMSELYLDVLQRVIDARSEFDRARELKAANDPRWKNAMRTARLACRDEEKFLCLVDRAIRGLCECMGMKTRIYFETISEINARKNQDVPDKLRQNNMRLRLTNMMLTKAIMFNLKVPDELLREGMDQELEEYVGDEIEKPELHQTCPCVDSVPFESQMDCELSDKAAIKRGRT
jgi:hypothetical protein